MSRAFLCNVLARAAAGLVAFVGFVLLGNQVTDSDWQWIATAAKAQRAEVPAIQAPGPKSLAPVAEQLIDAVVNISTSQVSKDPKGVPLPSVPEGSPFEEFFEDFFNKDGDGPGRQRMLSSLGSGFVIDGKAGLVVTNNHVITDADEIVINFHDGRKLKVEKILGVDTKTDIALLKVKPDRPLADVKFGRSKALRVGDWVMAIGNPFGLGGSVTVGIISAKQRDIQSGPYDEYLQTDAAINKGNSGGPLFNMRGEVIGINTAIISPTGGSIGIGFAVPSDTAVSIIDQLQKYGQVRRGWLGVKIQTVTEDIALSLGVPANTGALVGAVEPSSPADKGGIKAGDVIVEFNGEQVLHMRGLPRIVARSGVGQTVDVVVLREGATKKLRVNVGRLDESTEGNSEDGDAQVPEMPPPGRSTDGNVLAMKIQALNTALRETYGIESSTTGVVVVEVESDSEAATRGILAGHVIVEVGGVRVDTPDDVERAVAAARKAAKKAVLLRVESAAGDLKFVALPLE